jgi:hypothetical protein
MTTCITIAKFCLNSVVLALFCAGKENLVFARIIPGEKPRAIEP